MLKVELKKGNEQKLKVELKKSNEQKFLNDTAYLEFDTDESGNDTVDFCLGQTLDEAGKICRQIMTGKVRPASIKASAV